MNDELFQFTPLSVESKGLPMESVRVLQPLISDKQHIDPNYLTKAFAYKFNLPTDYPTYRILDENSAKNTEIRSKNYANIYGFDPNTGEAKPEELEQLRYFTDPNNKIWDITATNYKYLNYLGLGKLGDFLYKSFENPHVPYIASGLESQKLINKKIKHKSGGRLVTKHAKGSPVNNNPLPEISVNTNPIPKKEDKKKKKLFEIDLRVIGLRPTPGLLTFPKGNGNGLYMIKRNE